MGFEHGSLKERSLLRQFVFKDDRAPLAKPAGTKKGPCLRAMLNWTGRVSPLPTKTYVSSQPGSSVDRKHVHASMRALKKTS